MKESASDRRIEIELDVLRESFERSGNPHYAWRAIDFCIKRDLLVLPPWLTIYLAQCSERILSDTAMQTSDLRQILPWVLGFPQKRGPGKPLNPYDDPKQNSFAFEFSILVLNGTHPVTARRDACNAVFHGKDAEVDDKTLVRHLLKQLGLKKAPKSAKQWHEAAYKNLAAFITARALKTLDVADYEAAMAVIERIPKLFGTDKVSRDSDVSR